MSALRKIKRVGKKASKFQYTATYQSVVVECQKIESWKPNKICVSWSRRGRRFFTKKRPWQASLENPMRGVVIWPEKELMEITVTLYKSPKDTSYETKEWEFNVIDVDSTGKRKILGSTNINMVRYASTMPFDHDVQLQLKPVSRKIKRVILDITLCSILLKEGKATDEDMLSIASMMSVSNLSMICNLEDDDDDNYAWHGGRSITPPPPPESILSPEELLKWTQEVTAGYRGVKITNMTTSWRTGMGFLAIIHYYRPDLIDIEAVSPNAIKENNKLSFDLAQHLGISCPLTPTTMISATIPDKLLVSSFLFNMHQYFTKALPSVIVKDSTQNGSTNQTPTSGDKPSSPFDISKIHKVFDDPNIYNNLSPVHSPAHTTENRYSRHSSRRNSGNEEPTLAEGRTIPVPSGGYGVKTHSSSSSLVLSTKKDGTAVGQGETEPDQGGVNSGQSDAVLGQRELKTALDKLALANQPQEESPVPQITVSDGHTQVSEEEEEEVVSRGEGGRGVGEVKESTEQDRLLEFEADTSSELQTSSSVSLDIEVQGEGTQSSTSLPSTLPTVVDEHETEEKEVDGSQLAASGEERSEQSSSLVQGELVGGEGGEGGRESGGFEGERRRSEEVMRFRVEEQGRRKSEGFSSSKPHRRLPAIPAGSPETVLKSEKLRQKAKELLRKHRISPGTSEFFTSSSTSKGKPLDSKQERYREQARQILSGLNTPNTGRPHHASVEDDEHTASSSTASLPEIHEREEKEEEDVKEERKGGRAEERQSEREGESVAAGKNALVSERDSRHSTEESSMRRRVGVVDRPQVVVVGGGEDLTSAVGDQRPRSASSHEGAAIERLPSEKSQPNRGRAQTDADMPRSSQRKKVPVKKLEIKPVQTKPSAAAQRLVEKKREMREMMGVVEKGEGGDRVAGDRGNEGEEEMQNGGTNEVEQTNKMESPSPWYEHNEGLQQDILLTRNEYVRCELGRLQGQLQNMEMRAKEIEIDVRHAMSTGNKEEEEAMMQEWFSLLNGKNELIKRQIELNLIEKEEDLEKKQFFINRELRPLMQIPDDQKTPQQRARAEVLMQDHLAIIDERDRLERRKMSIISHNATRSPDNQTGGAVHERHGGKDCVIS